MGEAEDTVVDNSAAPAAAPASTPAETPDAGSESLHDDVVEGTGFDDLLRDPDQVHLDSPEDDGEEAESPQLGEAKPAAEKPVVPAKPAEKPQPEVKPAETPVTPETPKPAEAAKPAEQPKPPEAAKPAEQPTIDIQKLRDDTINELASQYTFTETEVEQLHEAPEKALPALAAKVTVQAYEAASRTILGHLPSLVEHIISSYNVRQDAEARFAKEYPELMKPEYRETLLNAAQLYRKMNPDKSYEEAAPSIAALVAMQLKIALGGPAAAGAPAASPQTPPVQRSQPHTPALPGAGGPQVSQDPKNPFEELSKEFEEID